MKNLLFLLLIMLIIPTGGAFAQTYQEKGQQYPLTVDGKKYIISGFTPFADLSDEAIYVNALLWAIDNISPKMRENLNNINIAGKSFAAMVSLAPTSETRANNIYHCKAVFHVASGKLIFHISEIVMESSGILGNKVIPLEKLTPEKKESHKEIIEDFTAAESLMLNKIFDFILSNKPATITHWEEIGLKKAVKGMNETECKLACGKPQNIQENGNEIQWMYTSSFYLFFKNGILDTIIK